MIFNVIYAKRKKHVRIYWFYHLSRRRNNPASLTLLQKTRTTASATEGRPSSEKQALRKRYSSRWSPPMDLRRTAILMTSNARWRWQIYSDKSRPLKNDKNPRFSTKSTPLDRLQTSMIFLKSLAISRILCTFVGNYNIKIKQLRSYWCFFLAGIVAIIGTIEVIRRVRRILA